MTDRKVYEKRLLKLFPEFMRVVYWRETNDLATGRITIPQFWVLEGLTRNKVLTMRELAGWMNTNLSSATGIVDRMIKMRLIQRHRGLKDRRVVRVAITARGLEVLKKIYAQKAKTVSTVLSILNKKECGEYITIVEKIMNSLTGYGK